MEERKKNENNMAWRPQLLAKSIVSATVYECLFLHMGQTGSALMSHIDSACSYIWGKQLMSHIDSACSYICGKQKVL
jgi:hypothetical protein